MDFKIEKIAYTKDVREWIKNKHYTQAVPFQVKYCFGLYNDTELCGVILYSHFSRLQSREKYFGCLELSRLYLIEGLQKNTASYFIGATLREVRKNKDIYGIISYADLTEGHIGTVYKASNFVQIGITKPSYHYVTNDGKRVHKKQVWARSRINNMREDFQAREEGLTRVPEKPKNIFYFEFKKPPEIVATLPVVSCENDDFVEIEICGLKTKVSKDDVGRISEIKWYTNLQNYFYHFNREGKRVYLHRMINNTPTGFVCDHINRDRLDNRRENLRAASFQQNNANKSGKRKFKGVLFKKNKYQANLVYDRKNYYLGSFDSEVDAAIAYDEKAVEISGRFAVTNFDINKYNIPEKSLSEIEMTPSKQRRYKNKKKCMVCERTESVGSGFCRRHLTLYLRREANNPDGEGRINNPRVQQKSEHCIHDNCEKETFSGNLCYSHWRENQISLGLMRRYEPEKRRKYFCAIEGCQSRVYLERLCKSHWREEKGIEKKKLGRPPQEKRRCILCNEDEYCSELCKNHYDKYMYYRRTKQVDTVLSFTEKVKSGEISFGNTGRESVTGQKYVRILPDGRFSVVISRKTIWIGNSIEDAVKARDEYLKHKD